MIPFFQGKIDNFCAAYAVLNALQLVCGVSAFQTRSLFADLLLRQSRDEARFKAILYHTTDYLEMVDDFLATLSNQYPIKVTVPFSDDMAQNVSADEVWQTLGDYAAPDRGRTAVFRFCRYAALGSHPIADHWTTAHRVENKVLHFFDCSLEAQGIYALPRNLLKDHERLRPLEYVLVPPRCIRLIEYCSEKEARQRTDSWLF